MNGCIHKLRSKKMFREGATAETGYVLNPYKDLQFLYRKYSIRYGHTPGSIWALRNRIYRKKPALYRKKKHNINALLYVPRALNEDFSRDKTRKTTAERSGDCMTQTDNTLPGNKKSKYDMRRTASGPSLEKTGHLQRTTTKNTQYKKVTISEPFECRCSTGSIHCCAKSHSDGIDPHFVSSGACHKNLHHGGKNGNTFPHLHKNSQQNNDFGCLFVGSTNSSSAGMSGREKMVFNDNRLRLWSKNIHPSETLQILGIYRTRDRPKDDDLSFKKIQNNCYTRNNKVLLVNSKNQNIRKEQPNVIEYDVDPLSTSKSRSLHRSYTFSALFGGSDETGSRICAKSNPSNFIAKTDLPPFTESNQYAHPESHHNASEHDSFSFWCLTLLLLMMIGICAASSHSMRPRDTRFPFSWFFLFCALLNVFYTIFLRYRSEKIKDMEKINTWGRRISDMKLFKRLISTLLFLFAETMVTSGLQLAAEIRKGKMN